MLVGLLRAGTGMEKRECGQETGLCAHLPSLLPCSAVHKFRLTILSSVGEVNKLVIVSYPHK